ncbi:type II secretion system GspH family protein, partial [Patescibacteria group bacterium]|nr:type II secretion system GspH family protein [Patescibacteria group bacterium]MBU2233678.1 type II secretion system GspH family protein [Patescibacteria group bacterium]MBU2264448.1 type II secretion system GspH family protein [Patescibacteria group bacterium]
FTLIELLVAISIIGFLVASSVVIFNIVRTRARDAVRAGNIATITRALAMYLNNKSSYPASAGECLQSGSGVGVALTDDKTLLQVPVDPLWPTQAPAHTNGVVNNGQTNFCYFYYSAFDNQYRISFYLESNSQSGKAGINSIIIVP